MRVSATIAAAGLVVHKEAPADFDCPGGARARLDDRKRAGYDAAWVRTRHSIDYGAAAGCRSLCRVDGRRGASVCPSHRRNRGSADSSNAFPGLSQFAGCERADRRRRTEFRRHGDRAREKSRLRPRAWQRRARAPASRGSTSIGFNHAARVGRPTVVLRRSRSSCTIHR